MPKPLAQKVAIFFEDVSECARVRSVVLAIEMLEVQVPVSTGLFDVEIVSASVILGISGLAADLSIFAASGRSNRIAVIVYHPRTVLPLRWELNRSLLVPGFKSLAEVVGSRPENIMHHYQHGTKKQHRKTVAKIPALSIINLKK